MIYGTILALALTAAPNADKLRDLNEACASLKLAWKAEIILDYNVTGHTKDGLPFTCKAEAPDESHNRPDRPVQNSQKDRK